MEKVKIVFMGTPEFSVPILKGLLDHYQVVGVVSQPDRKVGRKQEVRFTPVKQAVQKLQIPVFQPERIKEDFAGILKLDPDIIVTCAYGQLIPKEILEYPRLGCVNVHASLLPKLRGGAPIHKAIIEGYLKTGITIMYMDQKMDSGDIISQEETEILDTDTLETLHERLSGIGKTLLLKTLPSIIAGTNARISQDIEEVSFAYNIKREEEYLDFSKTSRELFNQIRGLSPTPSSCTILDGVEFKVYAARISDVTSSFVPGEIMHIYKDGIGVATKDYELVLLDIKPFGKKRMLASSFVNGIKKEDYIGKVFANEEDK